MNQRWKKCILCAGTLAFLAAAPAMAAVNLPASPGSSQREEQDPEKGNPPEKILEILENEENEGGTIQTGEQPPEDDPGDWFTKENLLKIAPFAGIGLAVVLAGAAGWRFFSHKNRNKQEEEPVSDSGSVTETMTETEPARKAAAGQPVLDTAPSARPRRAPVSFVPALPDAENGTLGMVHNVGRRKNQQDTLGTTMTRMGLLAVVSDGMGGLSDGEKVSQKAVMGMFQAAGHVAPSPYENPLYEMLSEANEQVLAMLGPDQIYKSGATLLAVLADKGKFHWAAVGDSRIYLYCSHHLLQINREHIYRQQLIGEAVNKNISFARAGADPQRDRLISFLGMGELKHIDGSLRPVELRRGDKLLLMSDGIFNTISEAEIMGILENTKNAAEAAALMEKRVLEANNPKQDNFTCIILDF
ncbi:MAG: serine/threonine-protein phosphatase [Enterocloster asparagiformis]|nr:serine/threonine-protein phosphatase [Enterocloster asparagiformis]